MTAEASVLKTTPNYPDWFIIGLLSSDINQVLYIMSEHSEDGESPSTIRYLQIVDSILQREKQLVKQQVEATRSVHIPCAMYVGC